MRKPKLTVIVPVYNERKTVWEILKRVIALPVSKEIIVVDNCSTDGTRELLKAFEEQWQPDEYTHRLEIIFQPQNLLKGTSVKTGIRRAHGEYVIVQDADLEYNPDDILQLLEHAQNHNAPVVFGSRLLRRVDKCEGIFAFGRRFLSWLFRALYRAEVTDVATCYKLMRTDVAQALPLQSKGFELDFEIPARLRLRGIPIIEVPISYKPRSVREGKKLRLWDGVKAIYVLLKCRLSKE
ncbi:MAG TPA: glycosyltransferase family 2 protein [Armatimonadetes bacterium]|nr:glycosyltransferase family 2 protein [Armatimonadota bacterium]